MSVLLLGLFTTKSPSTSNLNKDAYPEHLTGAFTGGFGEDTCHSCHFDYPLNYNEAGLRTEGLPDQYDSGNTYVIKIIADRPDLEKAGFQLAARFENGTQAGSFSLTSDSLQFTESVPDSIQYIQHSPMGTDTPNNGPMKWTVRWTAPEEAREIVLHLAVNVANGDASEFGDYILTKEIHLSHRK